MTGLELVDATVDGVPLLDLVHAALVLEPGEAGIDLEGLDVDDLTGIVLLRLDVLDADEIGGRL